jgi:Protein of unknown function DUF58
MGFAAINTGNNLLYLLLGMLLSLIVLSGLLSETAVRGAIAKRVRAGRGFAGAPLHALMRLKNGSTRLAGYSLKVREHFEEREVEQRPQPVFHLSPGTHRDVTLGLSFPRRGRYHSYGLRVETSFPFALFEKTRLFELPLDQLVYPRLLEEAGVEEQIEQLLGDATESQRPGRGLDDYGVRDMHPGDPMNRVHWKLTAKKGYPVIREFDDPRGRELNLLLVNTAQDYASGERAISFAATLLEAIPRLTGHGGQDLRLRFVTLTSLSLQDRQEHEPVLTDAERALEHLATLPLYTSDTTDTTVAAHTHGVERAQAFLEGQQDDWFVIAAEDLALPFLRTQPRAHRLSLAGSRP